MTVSCRRSPLFLSRFFHFLTSPVEKENIYFLEFASRLYFPICLAGHGFGLLQQLSIAIILYFVANARSAAQQHRQRQSTNHDCVATFAANNLFVNILVNQKNTQFNLQVESVFTKKSVVCFKCTAWNCRTSVLLLRKSHEREILVYCI